ncbi:MAG: hypothetical protein ACTHU0_30710 [Kofleriaceae bacterium]
MSDVTDLAQVLADARGEAAVLRRRGHRTEADAIDELCEKVQAAAEDYLHFIPEAEALLRGAKRAWLLRNRLGWQQDGHARRVAGKWEYRAILLPRATPASIARQAALQGERVTGKAS